MDKNKKTFCINFWAGIIGNILEYYDTAVFSLIVPFIAPLFFPTFDPITAMILTYGMLPLGTLVKPVGSLIFGRIGDRYGRKKALYYSLTGLAIVTGCMGCLPTFEQAGYLAPALMAIGRLLQNVFLGGEAAGGAVFILEHTKDSKHSLMSSLYGSSTIIGITLASCFITALSWTGNMEQLWRLPFLFGFATSLGGILIRSKAEESPHFRSQAVDRPPVPVLATLKKYWRPFLAIVAVSGFSSANYILALILPNGFLPKIADITTAEVMSINSGLLLADMAALPLFGWLADRLSPKRSMFYAAAASVLLSVPLYSMFAGSSWMEIVIIRTVLVALGVWFSAPLHAWIQTLVPAESRYFLISTGYAVGGQLLGAPAASVSLWIYRETGYAAAPGLYWAAAAAIAGLCIFMQPSPKAQLSSAAS